MFSFEYKGSESAVNSHFVCGGAEKLLSAGRIKTVH